jgi:hypothetical protein
MTNLNKLTIIKEKSSNSITTQLVARFKELMEKETISIQMDVVDYDEEAIQQLSGDILLLSLPLMHEIRYLNRLKTRFYFVSFIDPYAYTQIDARRLLKQLRMIQQFESEKISKFHPKSSWTYADYFFAMTQMKKEATAIKC